MQAQCPDVKVVVLAIVLQGARVWLRHKEQLRPSTVSSCDDSTLILTTDYGKVRRRSFSLVPDSSPWQYIWNMKLLSLV